MVDAVKKAGEEKEGKTLQPKSSPPKSSRSFLMASAIFLIMGGVVAALYFYEEAKNSVFGEKLGAAQAALNDLKSQNEALLVEKTALENRADEQEKTSKEKIDELLGRSKVLQYEKETLEADNTQKEKQIAQLQDQISKQDEKEAKLMVLIEEAKKQISAPVAAPMPNPVVAESPAPAAPAKAGTA